MPPMCPNSAKGGSVFKLMDAEKNATSVFFTFDGQSIEATRDMTVAAALLAHGINRFRETIEDGTQRGPFCMMGTCYDCLVLVDGVRVQACMTPVRSGLVVARVPTETEGDDQ